MAPDENEPKSRTQLKREFQELTDLARELVDLSPAQLNGIPLSERTRDGIVAAREMARSALQRQLRYLTNRIEAEDVAAIRDALAGDPCALVQDSAVPDDAQRWSDELVSEGDQLLSQFIDEHPEVDRQHLRQLVRNARKERGGDDPQGSARQLADYLRGVIGD